jgi:hypothetical protein
MWSGNAVFISNHAAAPSRPDDARAFADYRPSAVAKPAYATMADWLSALAPLLVAAALAGPAPVPLAV